jgi:hypothetical protein
VALPPVVEQDGPSTLSDADDSGDIDDRLHKGPQAATNNGTDIMTEPVYEESTVNKKKIMKILWVSNFFLCIDL